MATTEMARRAATALAVAAIAVAWSGCGGSDDGPPDAAQAPRADASESSTAVAATSDEEAIRATLKTVQEAFYAGDGETVCEAMTAKAREQGEQAAHLETCGANFSLLGEQSKDLADEGAEVVSVRIDGDRARAMTRPKGSRLRPAPVLLAKEGGSWKIASLVSPPSGP